MKKNQSGFSVVEGLLILVIVGILCGTGWYVWNSNKKTNDILNSADKSSNVTAKSSKQSETKKEEFKLPDGYVWYKYDKLGFSVAYPKEWGDLTAPTDPNFKGYTVLTKSIDNKPIGRSLLQGWFGKSWK
jgi:type II secretory pathway pseudopilin PulG